MTFSNSIILGIVEGLTEFLPISSTAHLIIASKLLYIKQTGFHKFLEVFIQTGAISAVLLIYWRYLKENKDILLKIIVSFIPTAVVGLLLFKIIKSVFFESYSLIAFSLIFIGLLFIVIETLIKNKLIILNKQLENLSLRQAFIIGLVQSLAVIPGVSRAGAVILIMLVLGYRRKEAALYSFLLAVPTIFAAGGFDLLKTNLTGVSSQEIFLLMISLLVSFIVALAIIQWFISFLKRNSLIAFGLYRIGLGFLLLIFLG